MGFDNECIVNIQSLAGEYFCPVCRLLVYPNEALQSQCTHLYCKPCLTYIVSTTRACPYDGYLVTEADSKPLIESNKTLAETIGKIPVHCLYHRSGCTWQGSLSDCTSHCSGCAFGSSPVVCNRCQIQIVHRQVQEHAQNCPGVQAQVQQTEVAQNASVSSATSTDQNQTAAQAGALVSQAPISQTMVAAITPGQDSSQLTNPTSQTQPLVQTIAQPTAEQLYQQQQYQQYYQQYPGYDPYQQQYQQYYPYQQPVAPQYQQHVQAYVQPQPQSQSQPQPQAQPQSQPQSQSQQLPQAYGQSQPISQVQAPAAPQSQNQTQVSQQQQLQAAVQPHSQIQSLSHPAAHSQPLSQPQPYLYPQMQPHTVQTQPQQQMQIPQYQQPHPQMQHLQPQVQQPVQSYLVSQPQVRPQLQPHAPVQHLSQPQMYPQQVNQPLAPNIQPQLHHTSAHAVTGHQTHPQPQPHQNMQLGATQLPMHMPPQGGSQAQSQHPIQVKNQPPQQSPMTRSLQSHATFPNQQQPGLLPSPVQGHHFFPSQQQALYAPTQHPGQTNQRPVMQPGQQSYIQQLMPMSSHLGPQGQAQHSQTYPQPEVNVAPTHNTQHNQSQNAIGRPSMHNQAVQSLPFVQSASAIPARPVHSGTSNLPENQNIMVGTNNHVRGSAEIQSMASGLTQRQGDVSEQQNDSSSWKLGRSVKDFDTMSGSATEMKPVKSETDMKKIEVKKQNGGDPQWTSVAGANVVENSELGNKNLVKEEATESKWQPLSVNKPSGDNCNELAAAKGKEIQDGPLLKNSSLETEVESQSGNGPPSSGDNAPAAISQPLATPQGTATVQHRPNGISASQLPFPGLPNQPLSTGNPSSQLRNQGPANALHPGQPLIPAENYQQPVFKHPQGSDIQHSGLPGPGYPGEPTHRSSPGLSFQSLAPPGLYNQGHQPTFHAAASNLSHVESVGGPQFVSLPPGDMHVAMRPPAPEGLRGPKNMMAAETVPHQMPRCLNGPQSFNTQEERLKSFPVPGQSNIDRREFEDDLKKFPRSSLDAEPASKLGNYSLGPHERGFRGFNYDRRSKYNSGEGAAASGFFPHPHLTNEAGERPLGFHDDAMGKSDSAHHPDYFGFGPGYGRHMNSFTPRSPVGEYAEISSRRLGPLSGSLHGKSGVDDLDCRDPCHFGDSVGTAFLDSRYPHLPSRLQRGEFEGPGNLRMGEHPMSDDFIGHDGFTGQFRGEYLGPHNLPRHMQLGEPLGFGPHIGHFRDAEHGGPRSFESFSRGNRQGHPRLGEPGFRSSLSLPGFPNDGGFLTGDIGSFNNLRKRKAASRGWCRICKVDCESVEGLDLHAQTREHQKMAMDMVKSIKQNAKKQKLAPSEQSYVEDGSKSRNAGSEARGTKR